MGALSSVTALIVGFWLCNLGFKRGDDAVERSLNSVNGERFGWSGWWDFSAVGGAWIAACGLTGLIWWFGLTWPCASSLQ